MKTTNNEAGKYIIKMEDFTNSTGSFWGRRGPVKSYGWLEDDERLDLEARSNWGFIEYVVYSYGTPIAWYCNRGGWETSEMKHSNTTNRHQYHTRRALA